jgi:glutamyl-tRNA synthetase
VSAIEVILPEVGPQRGAPSTLDPAMRAKLTAAMPGLKERAKTLIELIESAYYLYARRPLGLEPKAEALLADGGRERIKALIPAIEAVSDWTAAETEGVVRHFAETNGLKLGQVAQPLRAALTGRATSPGLFDVMQVLGREECLARLRDQAGSRAA